MSMTAHGITPCLWFDTPGRGGGEVLRLYLQGREDRKDHPLRKRGIEIHGKPAGTVMTVEFEIGGQKFIGLNGGPHFKFNEAVSFQVHCETQDEIDYFWSKLAEGGEEGPCGWLKDKFGLSWQVVPTALPQMLMDENSDKAQRVMRSMLQMRKIDLAALKRAQAA